MTDRFIGVPYKHNGRDFDGFDCVGVVVSYLKYNGVTIPDGDGRRIEKDWYNQNPDRLIEGLKNIAVEVSFEDLRPLDILLFEFNGIPRHLGVVTKRGYFLHIRQRKKTSICRIKRYKQFLHSIYRVVE